MSELRRDPIVGRQVLIAEDRAGRPNDFRGGEPANSVDQPARDCPFCGGREELTPAALLEVPGDGNAWQVRVVPNKYPAVSLGCEARALSANSSLESSPQVPIGSHEVIIESPRHVQDITELSVEEFAQVLRTYRDRVLHWSTDERVRYCSVFKNVGIAAGASLQHVHSQLVALPEIPPVMLAELGSAEYYLAKHRTCIFCKLIDDELELSQRLVVENDKFVAFCAFAGRQPYETWILPRDHSAQFEQLSDAEATDLSALLRDIVGRLLKQLSPLAYNLILHSSPFRQDTADYFHWHFELVPRSTQLAGFEWGTGMHINPLSPERAAARINGEEWG